MRVLQVINQLNLGGAERVCVNLANLFSENGHDVVVMVFEDSGPLFSLLNDDVEVVILNLKSDKSKAKKTLIAEVKKADIIHAHMRRTFRVVKRNVFLSRVKKKIIFHDHYGKIDVDKNVPTFFKTLYKPDFYIGCSELLTNWALEKLKLPKERVFFIKNYVPKLKIDSSTEPERKGIVLVANLKPVKNHIFAVKIAKALNKELTIYCFKDENTYYGELREQIKELGMTECVHFKHDCLNIQEELHYYEFALLTSITEGDPLVLIEYLAQGIPFLCSDIGESVKVIASKFPFFIQQTFDLEEWVNNASRLKGIKRENISKLYDKFYSENLFLGKYLEVYSQLKSIN